VLVALLSDMLASTGAPEAPAGREPGVVKVTPSACRTLRQASTTAVRQRPIVQTMPTAPLHFAQTMSGRAQCTIQSTQRQLV